MAKKLNDDGIQLSVGTPNVRLTADTPKGELGYVQLSDILANGIVDLGLDPTFNTALTEGVYKYRISKSSSMPMKTHGLVYVTKETMLSSGGTVIQTRIENDQTIERTGIIHPGGVVYWRNWRSTDNTPIILHSGNSEDTNTVSSESDIPLISKSNVRNYNGIYGFKVSGTNKVFGYKAFSLIQGCFGAEEGAGVPDNTETESCVFQAIITPDKKIRIRNNYYVTENESTTMKWTGWTEVGVKYHKDLTGKNSEANYQHITSIEKTAMLKVTGMTDFYLGNASIDIDYILRFTVKPTDWDLINVGDKVLTYAKKSYDSEPASFQIAPVEKKEIINGVYVIYPAGSSYSINNYVMVSVLGGANKGLYACYNKSPYLRRLLNQTDFDLLNSGINEVGNETVNIHHKIDSQINELRDAVFPTTISVSASPTIGLINTTVSVTINYTVSRQGSTIIPNTVTVNGNNVTPGQPYTTSITSTTVFTVVATVGSKTLTRSVSVPLEGYTYYGITSNAIPTEAEILAGSKTLKNSRGFTYSGITMDNKKVYYVIPVSLGAITSIKDANGFEYIGGYTSITMTISGVSSYVYYMTNPTTVANFRQIFA